MHSNCHLTRLVGLVLAAILLTTAACADSTGPAVDRDLPANSSASAASRDVTIDFSAFGDGKNFDPEFYRSDGILFPPEACGSAGCAPWFVGFVAGDAALIGDPRRGPLTADFKKPISELSLSVAPTFLGTARYTLNLYSPSGALVATASVTVTQDPGDPADTGFGYFTISVSDLPKAVKSFALDNVFLRSSATNVTVIPYGVNSITFGR